MSGDTSRDTYHPGDGFLGVYLEQGAPLVDADVNEAQDIQWHRARQIARDAGLVGTSGRTFRIDPVEPCDAGPCTAVPDDDDAVRFWLRIQGGHQPFYVNGVPLIFDTDRLVQAAAPPGTYLVQLLVRIGTVDAIERPDLHDPAIQASTRGTFRRMPRCSLDLRPFWPCTDQHDQPSACPRSEFLLTTRGTLLGPNANYRIELADSNARGRVVDLLWDPDNASIRTRIRSTNLVGGTRSIEVDDPDGFEQGHLVRLEGPGLFEHLPPWPEVLEPRERTLDRRCPIYQISGVFGDLLYLVEADRNRPTNLEVFAPRGTNEIRVRSSGCWVADRRIMLGFFQPSTLRQVDEVQAGRQTLQLEEKLDLPDFDHTAADRKLQADNGSSAEAESRIYELQTAEGPALRILALQGTTLTLATPEAGVTAASGDVVFVHETTLDAADIERVHTDETGTRLVLDAPLTRSVPVGPRRVHLPESEDAMGVEDLIQDYLETTPTPTTPVYTDAHALLGPGTPGDQQVLVHDDGVWTVGRAIEIGVAEQYRVERSITPATAQGRKFLVDPPRSEKLSGGTDPDVQEVTFRDARGQVLARAHLIELAGDTLVVRDSSSFPDLTGARIEVRVSLEERRIVRIQRPRQTPHGVVLLLDSPLLLDHPAGSHGVAPLDRQFVRRFAGATWDAPTTLLDEPQQDVPLDRGLEVRVLRSNTYTPFWRAGEGWSVWTRSVGKRSTLFEAPVDDEPTMVAPLALVTVGSPDAGSPVQVEDLRARPGRPSVSIEVAITTIEERYNVELRGAGPEILERWDDDPEARYYMARLLDAMDEDDAYAMRELTSALARHKPSGPDRGEGP